LQPGNVARVHWTEYCMGPRASLDAVGKALSSLPGIESWFLGRLSCNLVAVLNEL
jgi:hypothetical protein